VLVDQSGSMTDPYSSGRNRWQAVRYALLRDPDGVVAINQGQVRFGMVLYTYSGAINNEEHRALCPTLTHTAMALDNLSAMQSTYDANGPLGDTPTGESIDHLVCCLTETDKSLCSRVDAHTGSNTDPDPCPGYGAPEPQTPTYILLATDGEPDHCHRLNPNPTARAHGTSIAAAERAKAAGIGVFVLSVGADVSTDHLQDVANAGAGRPIECDASISPTGCTATSTNRECWCSLCGGASPPSWCPTELCVPGECEGNAPYYVATDDAALDTALGTIVGTVLSCVVRLSRDPLREPRDGVVYLDGDPLEKDGIDGWRILDPDTIELVGGACDTLKDGQPHFVGVVIDTCTDPG
jgi:hypothetical protein